MNAQPKTRVESRAFVTWGIPEAEEWYRKLLKRIKAGREVEYEIPGATMYLEVLRLRRLLEQAAQIAEQQERVLEPLRKFALWALEEGPFDGCGLDGDDIQNEAESLGLIVEHKYDPAIHGPSDIADPGDDWYVCTAILADEEQIAAKIRALAGGRDA